MPARTSPNAPAAILVSWSAAVIGGLGALALIAGGQGLGALLGGCRWIGVSLPIERQVWALVNQPSLAFSSHPSSAGYWLGGTTACLVIAVGFVPLFPRPRTMAFELLALQISWGAAVVGLGWMALLDPTDGHLSRFLLLHDLPAALTWIVPVTGAWAALIPTHRLLALERAARPQLGRGRRILTVGLHFVLPSLGWIAAGTMLASRFETTLHWAPVLAAALPAVAALFLSWSLYPAPWVYPLEPVGIRGVVVTAAVATLLAVSQIVLGGPAGAAGNRGVLWAPPDSRNNIRSWIVLAPISDAVSLRTPDGE